METPLNHQLSIIVLTPTVNIKMQPSLPLHLPFTGPIKKESMDLGTKSKLINSTNHNTLSSGKDQVNFEDLQIHLFGVITESLQKPPNKVLLEIAGSFHQLPLLPVSHLEFTISSRIPNIHMMVLSRCISTSEVKK